MYVIPFSVSTESEGSFSFTKGLTVGWSTTVLQAYGPILLPAWCFSNTLSRGTRGQRKLTHRDTAADIEANEQEPIDRLVVS